MTRRPAALFLLATFCLSFGASAHHSRPAFFDMSKTVELAAGIRLTTDAVLQERFSLSADERRLDYEIIVTDPATFTEPVTQRCAWDWRPGETVKPYDCIETPGFWSSH